MTIDRYLGDIERLEAEGAIVILKWDGARNKFKRTVVINRVESDYQFRKDTDNLDQTIREGIDEYDAFHQERN